MKGAIYKFLQTIPQGKVISYKTLAKCFGTSPRAIGKIMNCNDDAYTFPCYKVVKHNGELGGYNGGIQKKIQKLEADGILIHNNKIPLDYFRHPNIENKS